MWCFTRQFSINIIYTWSTSCTLLRHNGRTSKGYLSWIIKTTKDQSYSKSNRTKIKPYNSTVDIKDTPWCDVGFPELDKLNPWFSDGWATGTGSAHYLQFLSASRRKSCWDSGNTGLERRPSGKEVFQRTQVQFAVPTWHLTMVWNSSFRGLDAFFWPL